MDGVFVVNKPAGWTSHDVVNKMRRIVGTKRVGHLGTLDPLATGVLPVVVGRATRLSQFYTRSEKLYEATVHFGYATDTYDMEGKPLSDEQPYVARAEQVERMLEPFRGTFEQVPPPVSAKKVGGTPAYKLARKNIRVELKPVEVTVHSLDLVACEGRQIRVKVHCSGGTYLRSIAHEIGQAAGVGAHLRSLVRLASGHFTMEQARTLEDLAELSAARRLEEALLPAGQLLPEFPSEVVDSITEGQIRQGRDFRVSPFRVRQGTRFVKALSAEGALVAIGEARLPNLYHPILVL